MFASLHFVDVLLQALRHCCVVSDLLNLQEILELIAGDPVVFEQIRNLLYLIECLFSRVVQYKSLEDLLQMLIQIFATCIFGPFQKGLQIIVLLHMCPSYIGSKRMNYLERLQLTFYFS